MRGLCSGGEAGEPVVHSSTCYDSTTCPFDLTSHVQVYITCLNSLNCLNNYINPMSKVDMCVGVLWLSQNLYAQ